MNKTTSLAVASLVLGATNFAAGAFVSKDEYLDLVEAAVVAYDDEHVAEYVADADANGVNEHGFPRLTANIGALISAGRMQGRRDLFRRMMDICCRDAKKGLMAKEGNEFSVKELVAAVLDVESAALFDKAVPNYDPDRFYVSHMKKVVDWYNEIKRYASLEFTDPEATEEETPAEEA